MIRSNHFPLMSNIRVTLSCYRPRNPRHFVGDLRRHGWDAFQAAEQVFVFHAQSNEPPVILKPISRQIFSTADNREHYCRGVNAHIHQLLCGSCFIRLDSRQRREYISPSNHVLSLVVAERGPRLPSLNVRAHLSWTWDLEWCEGSLWLVPLPGRCFLTSEEPRFHLLDRWLLGRLVEGERIKTIDLNTGRHRTLTRQGEQWGTLERGAWVKLYGSGWRITLDMKSLEKLGYSVEAARSAKFSFDGLHEAVVRAYASVSDPITGDSTLSRKS